MNQRIQKQNIREKYWRYSLYVILLGLGTVIFVELIPFLGGLLGALTIYVLLRGQMRALTIRHKLRRSLAASLLIGEAIVCFLIPLSLLVWLLVAKLQDVTLDPSTVIQPIRNLAELIRERIGYNLLDGDNIAKLVELLPRAGQWVLQSIGSFAVNVVVLLFVLYFMLIGGREMESYLRKFIPFNRTVTQEFTREVVMIVRSNAIGIPLLAVIQGRSGRLLVVRCAVGAVLGRSNLCRYDRSAARNGARMAAFGGLPGADRALGRSRRAFGVWGGGHYAGR